MDASHGSSSNSPPPFLTKTYDMIDDPSTNSIVSWNPENNSSFIVWNHLDFARDLLPKYFKHNNFSSFVRQLNTYGFRKIDPDRWEFGNDEFIRGQKHLLQNIHRRKPIYSHSLHNQTQTPGPLTDPERQELQETINKLIHDKSILVLDFKKRAQYQEAMESQMQSLEQRLLDAEARQKNLISNLNRFVEKPDFVTNVSFTPDLHSKKRRLPKYEFIFDDDRIVVEDNVGTMAANLNSVDAFEKMESSLNSLESLFREASDNLTLPVPSPGVVVTEANTPVCSTSPMSSSSTSGGDDVVVDEGRKVSEIDVNAKPGKVGGVNDVFWQQFLTESPPVVVDMQEVQSERRGGGWWKRDEDGDNVECITMKMGTLASAEKT